MIGSTVLRIAFMVMLFLGVRPTLAQVSGNSRTGFNNSSGLFGQRSLGGGGFSQGGGAQSLLQPERQFGGQFELGERFGRESLSQAGAGGFVGTDREEASNVFSRMQGATASSGIEQFLQRAAQREFENQSGNSASREMLRPRLTLGFEPSADLESRLGAQMSHRLARIPGLQITERVTVALQGRTAVLRGRVASEHDRSMLARLALLEPGVSDVQNDIAVGRHNEVEVVPESKQAPPPTRDDGTVVPIPPPVPEDVHHAPPTAPSFDH